LQIIAENALSADIPLTPSTDPDTKPIVTSKGAIAPTYKQRIASFNTARNFVSPTLNFLLMNNGYHTIHHHKPFLHWSLLKEAHEREVKPYIDSRLDQPSIWGYMFKLYVYPGIRVDYRDQPVVFDRTPEQSGKGDWMNMPPDLKKEIDDMPTRERVQFITDGVVVMLLKLVSPIYSPFAAAD
jgi:hypothetical protein